MMLLQTIKSWFAPPAIKVIIAQDLDLAYRRLLHAQSMVEHWQADVNMAQARIERLKAASNEDWS